MSRTLNETHPAHVGKRSRRPKPERKRKHRPYGLHRVRYSYEWFKEKGWALDTDERWKCSDVGSKAKGRREGKKEINRQMNDF